MLLAACHFQPQAAELAGAPRHGTHTRWRRAGVTKASLIAALADVGASEARPVTYRERYAASADGRSAVPDR
jgi:hypothetical protein